MSEQPFDWLFKQEVQDFLRTNENQDPERLLLSKSLSAKGWDTRLLVRQLKGRRTAKTKFPTWYACDRILYPVAVSLEQASSEVTARFKASLVTGTLADVSGGMGIDSYFFSLVCSGSTYVEPQAELFALTLYNFSVLKTLTISGECTTADDFLKQSTASFDWLYIDPSRRKADKRLADYKEWEPDIIGLKPLFWQKAKQVMIKLSPMTDLSAVCREMGEVKEVYVLSDRNDCKEVLLLLQKDYKEEPLLHAVMLGDPHREFVFTASEEQQAEPLYSAPLKYLYEPDVALLKAGLFKKLALLTHTKKIHPHTHLYTSEELVEDFPGKKFQIKEVMPFSKKNAAYLMDGGKDAHVLTRQATVTSEEVKKQLKLVERGKTYLIVFKGLDGAQYIAKAERIDFN